MTLSLEEMIGARCPLHGAWKCCFLWVSFLGIFWRPPISKIIHIFWKMKLVGWRLSEVCPKSFRTVRKPLALETSTFCLWDSQFHIIAKNGKIGCHRTLATVFGIYGGPEVEDKVSREQIQQNRRHKFLRRVGAIA